LREINDQHVRDTNEQNAKKLVTVDKIAKFTAEKLTIETLLDNLKKER
jgi:hypothetical protein